MRFFVLHAVIGAEAETDYDPVGAQYGDAPRCPKCGAYVGLKPWLPPYRAELRVHGDRVGDVAFGTGNDLLLSPAFVTAWREHGLASFGDPDPVEITSLEPRRLAVGPLTYLHLATRKSGARIDPEKSRIVRQEPSTCDVCGGPELVIAYSGIRLLPGSWTGEDIFMPWGLNGLTIVTERVVALAAERHLANVTTTPLEAYSWDPRVPKPTPPE